MRFKKGCKVEVMNKNETPISWRVAEIVTGNGHSYSIRHEGVASQSMVEKVSRKHVRPCPPLLPGMEDSVAGDIIEIFDDFSWKIATILKVLRGDEYLVRLLGCSRELIINRSHARMRQTWHDGKWVLMGKISRGCEDGKASKLSTSHCYQKISCQVPQVNGRGENETQKDCWDLTNDHGTGIDPAGSSRSRKRTSAYCSSIIEGNKGQFQKRRAIGKEDSRQRVLANTTCEKVDAVAYPRETLGDKYMHASFNDRSYRYDQMERAIENNVGSSGLRNSGYNDSDSDACSVGSCSVNDQSLSDHNRFMPVSYQVTDTLCSDAESCCGSDSEEKSRPHPPKEEVEANIHRLELHAYQCTLEALYASGPLSWEQEALLTNLRIMLHISNDEHLMELKCLISDKTGPLLEACIICFQRLKDDARGCCLSLGIIYWHRSPS